MSKALTKKKKFKFPSAYTVLLAIMIVIALVTQVVPGVKKAQLSDIVMAPVTGMVGLKDNALDEAISTSMNEGGINAALETINNAGFFPSSKIIAPTIVSINEIIKSVIVIKSTLMPCFLFCRIFSFIINTSK